MMSTYITSDDQRIRDVHSIYLNFLAYDHMIFEHLVEGNDGSYGIQFSSKRTHYLITYWCVPKGFRYYIDE